MAGFLYFHPNSSQPVTLAIARELGLGYAFTAAPSSCQCLGPNTPGGTNGMVFADGARMGEWAIRVDMAEQRWEKSADGDWYVGYWKAAPPTPDDLVRPVLLRGFSVDVGGFAWQVPFVADFDCAGDFTPALPRKRQYTGKGHWTKGELLETYRELWAIGKPFRDGFIAEYANSEPSPVYSDDELGNALMLHLRANYVLGPDEISMLDLASDELGTKVAILAANDQPTIFRWASQKKSTEAPAIPAGQTTANGGAG